MKVLTRGMFTILCAALFAGCASQQSLSSYARTGDTVMVALGGTEDSNVLVDILKKEDISVTITDSALNTYPVKLRHLFRIYPDNTSTYTFNTKMTGGGNAIDAYAPALVGQWLATVDLVDPVTDSKPVLQTGPAELKVSSPAQLVDFYDNPGYGWTWTNGNLASINIEILPGEGSSNALNYLGPMTHDPVADLEPLPQIMVTPPSPVTVFAGGWVTFAYNESDFSGGLVPVQSNHDPNVQIISNTSDLPDGRKQMEVMVLNPYGFMTNNNRTGKIPVPGGDILGVGKMSPLRSSRFALMFKNTATANDDINWQSYIEMTDGYYIDLQGNIISGMTPILSKAR